MGWHFTRHGTLIPAEQILGPGELVRGLDRVMSVIQDACAAWRFLSEECPFFDRPQRPIELLKAGNLDEVLAAAETSGDAFT
jgi:hypothetical protein